MPYPEKKKQRLQGHHRCTYDEAAADNNSDFQASIESLSGDVLANVYGFLLPVDIMNARLNRKMREAAREAIIPPTYELVLDSARKCNAMNVLATSLPNLQKITLGDLGGENKYVDGDDPDEECELAARTVGYTTHDIGIISNFTKLRELEMFAELNGRYPCFFNFPHLQKLNIEGFDICVKFDLEMLAGLPVLKELRCVRNKYLTGNLNSLRVLKNTLEKVTIKGCRNVEGNIYTLRVLKDTLEKLEIDNSPLVKGKFMDMADFPHLKELHLVGTAVTGDIWDIGEQHFVSLKLLTLPKGVNGGSEREFQRISDAQDVVRTPYLFQKQRPEIVLKDWAAELSDDSPDSYDFEGEFDEVVAPKYIAFVRAASRIGYRWENAIDQPCEVNWLDPEPDRESTDYGKYMEELQKIEGQVDFFKGFYQPPPQEEFERIVERINRDHDSFDV